MRPFGCDPPAADNAARFHLENIGKVASDSDLELKLHSLHAVVGDIKILVHAATDPAADAQSKCPGRNRTHLGFKDEVRKNDGCRVVGDGAAAEQFPGLTVCVDGPAADRACIEEIQTLLGWPVDLAVQLAYQDCLTLMNGDLWRTDLDFERHDLSLS